MLRSASLAPSLHLVLDQDLKRFKDGLGSTRHGLRLRMAIHEGRIAVQQIRRLEQLGQKGGRAIDSWRRAYIRACEHASTAIDVLFDEHAWPEDGARERRFEYTPPKR
jgi:hypothetical protein